MVVEVALPAVVVVVVVVVVVDVAVAPPVVLVTVEVAVLPKEVSNDTLTDHFGEASHNLHRLGERGLVCSTGEGDAGDSGSRRCRGHKGVDVTSLNTKFIEGGIDVVDTLGINVCLVLTSVPVEDIAVAATIVDIEGERLITMMCATSV